jgi:hypothetical protein
VRAFAKRMRYAGYGFTGLMEGAGAVKITRGWKPAEGYSLTVAESEALK